MNWAGRAELAGGAKCQEGRRCTNENHIVTSGRMQDKSQNIIYGMVIGATLKETLPMRETNEEAEIKVY